MLHTPTRLFLSVLVLGAAVVACSSSKETEPEDHTPVRITLAVNGAAMADDTLRLHAGAVDTVRITFFNAADDNLDDAEAEHYSSLTFPGGVNAIAATDSVAHYNQLVVNTESAGTVGMVSVGYGHDALADENTLTALFKFE